MLACFRHFRAFVGACRESRIQHKRLFVSGITGRCRSSSGLVRSFHAAWWRELVSCVCSEATSPRPSLPEIQKGYFREFSGTRPDFSASQARFGSCFLRSLPEFRPGLSKFHAARWRTFDSSAFPVAPEVSVTPRPGAWVWAAAAFVRKRGGFCICTPLPLGDMQKKSLNPSGSDSFFGGTIGVVQIAAPTAPEGTSCYFFSALRLISLAAF